MEEKRPPGASLTTTSPVRVGFIWSWYPHTPGLSRVTLQLVPGWTGFLGSNAGYFSCVGWSSEAGQWPSRPTFSKTTVSPATASTDAGSNPSSVTCTATLPPSSSWAKEASIGARNRATDKQARRQKSAPARRSVELRGPVTIERGYEIQ